MIRQSTDEGAPEKRRDGDPTGPGRQAHDADEGSLRSSDDSDDLDPADFIDADALGVNRLP